jgi:hypothetical protein
MVPIVPVRRGGGSGNDDDVIDLTIDFIAASTSENGEINPKQKKNQKHTHLSTN